MSVEGTKRVSVAVRVRPVLRQGISHTHQQERFELEAVSRIGDNQLKVEQRRLDEACRCSSFTFDYIFDQESTQLEVYEDSVVDLVDAALVGSNATILAYGQTGSGKTHTVLGEVKPNPLENDLLTHNSGLFLRVLGDLMEYKRRQAGKKHIVVGLSCVEIYNENIRDLFGGTRDEAPPSLRAVMVGDDVSLPSLIVKEVTTLQAVFAEIQLAISRRQSRSTEANATSSRSHCLFMIDILQQAATADPPPLTILGMKKSGHNKSPSQASQSSQTSRVASPRSVDPQNGFTGTVLRVPGQTEPVYSSKILLADLAGSEKIKNSGVTGEGFQEATSINSSLTALGNVVHSLHDGSYVTYRTSNLTRLLKPTFSQPNSRVLLLAQVSPTQLTFDETISTLHFANKVKAMKVSTTTGAETERLQFEVIEAEKLFESIQADLHIWRTEWETQNGMVRRALPKHHWLFYDADAKRSIKMRDRLTQMGQIGAVALAEQEKVQAQAQRKAEDEKLHREFQSKVKEERDKLVSEYVGSATEARDGLKKEQVALANHRLLDLDVQSTGNALRIKIEEEVELIAIRKWFAQRGMKLTSKTLGISEAQIAELANKVNRKPRTVSPLDAQCMKEDQNYTCATWAHCSAKRFYASLMEMREAQYEMFLMESTVLELTEWAAKHPLPKESSFTDSDTKSTQLLTRNDMDR